MDISELENKNIGVLGVGEEGTAVARFLMKHKISPTLLDEKTESQISRPVLEYAKNNRLKTTFSADAYKHLEGFDLLFRSPGVSLDLLIKKNLGSKVTSQTRLFFSLAPCPIIGVTGTKGKGTTSTLIYEFLKESVRSGKFKKGKLLSKISRVYLIGNIGGRPPLEILDSLRSADIVVFELSNVQLIDLKQSPKIAVVLMVVPDHLDFHKNFREYFNSKTAITRFQNTGDIVIFNPKYPQTRKIASLGLGTKVKIDFKDLPSAPNIIGPAAFENLAAAKLAALAAGAEKTAVERAAFKFKGLPHRLQFVGSRKGVTFYNDSLSTIPESTIAAVRAISDPLILILGGTSKVIDFSQLAAVLSKAKHLKRILLIGQNKRDLFKLLSRHKNLAPKLVFGGRNMLEIFQNIKKFATRGDTVLLSPAGSSFDMFSNYKDRGKQFSEHAKRY